MRQLCFSQGADTQFTSFCVFVADACDICDVVVLGPPGAGMSLEGGVWGETWCPGFVSLCITAWAEIVSEKGTDGTLVVAENAFFVSAMCPICLIRGRSSYEMKGSYGTRPVPLRGRADGRAAGRQHLDSRTWVFLQRVFGQPLLASLLRVLLADCVCQNHMSSLEAEGQRVSTG